MINQRPTLLKSTPTRGAATIMAIGIKAIKKPT